MAHLNRSVKVKRDQIRDPKQSQKSWKNEHSGVDARIYVAFNQVSAVAKSKVSGKRSNLTHFVR